MLGAITVGKAVKFGTRRLIGHPGAMIKFFFSFLQKILTTILKKLKNMVESNLYFINFSNREC